MDLSANIASLMAALSGPQGGTGAAGPTGPVGPSAFENIRRKYATQASARPSPQGHGTPVANSIQQARAAAISPPFSNPSGSPFTAVDQSGTGNAVGSRPQDLATYGQGTPNTPETARESHPVVQGLDDLGGAFAKAHGLTSDHATVINALLAHGAPIQDVLSYVNRAEEGRLKSSSDTGEADLRDAQSRKLNAETAQGWEAQNAYGAGGLKGHEADLKQQGEQARLAETAHDSLMKRNIEHVKNYQAEEKEPAAGGPSWAGDQSVEGQRQLQHTAAQANPLANGVPQGQGQPAPDSLLRQVHDATNGNVELAHKLLTEAGWK